MKIELFEMNRKDFRYPILLLNLSERKSRGFVLTTYFFCTGCSVFKKLPLNRYYCASSNK